MPAQNPQTVLANSQCVTCYGTSLVEALEISLLDTISQNIGGEAPISYDNRLVYTQSNGVTTIIENPTGVFSLTALVPEVVSIHCHNAPNITSLTCVGNALLTVVDLVNCTTLAVLNFTACTALPSLNLSTLVTMTTLKVDGCSSLATLNINALTTVLNLTASTSGLTSFSAPVLATCTGSIQLNSSPSLAVIDLHALTSVGVFVYFYDCGTLTSISCPLLVSVGELHFESNNALTSVDFSALQSVNLTTISMFDCLVLPSLSLPAFNEDIAGFNAFGCFLLTSVSFNGRNITDGSNNDFRECALNQATVDLILAAGVAGSMASGSIYTFDGTSAAPGVQGQIDKAQLLLDGADVQTN